MRIEQALKIRDRAKSGIADAYYAAKSFGESHAKLLERRRAILDQTNKAPYWVRAFLDGYWTALMDHAYRADLVFGCVINGRFYSTHSNRPDYYEKQGLAPSVFSAAGDGNATKGHYWRESLDRGEVRPFFVSAD